MDLDRFEAAVKAFFNNHPYYLRPLGDRPSDQQLWIVFHDQYLSTSENLGALVLAEMFIQKVIETREIQLKSRTRGCTTQGHRCKPSESTVDSKYWKCYSIS